MTPGRRLRDLIRRDTGLLLPGAANALTARIIAEVGFEAAYLSGAGLTNTMFGLPDLGFLSLTDVATQASAISAVVDLPLVVDADTGFGNAVNVVRTVSVLEKSGAAAIQLEDQLAPKRCGHFVGQELITADEMTQKIRAAVDARRDDDFVVIARTDAVGAEGLVAALSRGARYVEAGADVLFIEGLRTEAEIHAAGQALPGVPKLINIVAGGRTPMLAFDELIGLGFAVVLYANAALQASIQATSKVLTGLKTRGSLNGLDSDIASFVLRQRMVNKDAYDALAIEYETSGAGQ